MTGKHQNDPASDQCRVKPGDPVDLICRCGHVGYAHTPSGCAICDIIDEARSAIQQLLRQATG